MALIEQKKILRFLDLWLYFFFFSLTYDQKSLPIHEIKKKQQMKWNVLKSSCFVYCKGYFVRNNYKCKFLICFNLQIQLWCHIEILLSVPRETRKFRFCHFFTLRQRLRHLGQGRVRVDEGAGGVNIINMLTYNFLHLQMLWHSTSIFSNFVSVNLHSTFTLYNLLCESGRSV